MQKLDYDKLHEEKVNTIFDHIKILTEIKESDTVVPRAFYNIANTDVIKDYRLKMRLLNKNLKFVGRQLRKDYKLARRLQKKSRAIERKIALEKLQDQSCELEIKVAIVNEIIAKARAAAP